MGSATAEDQAALLRELQAYKPVVQAIRKQKANGTWGDNILGVDPATGKVQPGVGTVPLYRYLVELGVPVQERAYRLAERIFYRLLSRDESPELLFEFKRGAKTNPDLRPWSRELIREGAVVALAHAGQVEDPRVRGAAHRVASEVSQFLRSELAEKPFVRRGSRTILHPDAHPPSLLSVGMVSLMPNLQRERAGFVERLATFLARPAPKRPWAIQVGKRAVKPTFQLLGDPIQADGSGRTTDIPLALYWIETLARLGVLHSSATAVRVLGRLLKECDDEGVWSPKNLRAIPRSASGLANFSFPLEEEGKTAGQRQSDVTFRLALIAKVAGWTLEYT